MTQNILIYQNRTLNHRGWSFLPKQCAAVRTYLELKIEPLSGFKHPQSSLGRLRCDTVVTRVVKFIVKIAKIANFDCEDVRKKIRNKSVKNRNFRINRKIAIRNYRKFRNFWL